VSAKKLYWKVVRNDVIVYIAGGNYPYKFGSQQVEMMQFWIPAGGNNAGGFHRRKRCRFGFQHAEMMQFCIPAGGNDAVLNSSKQK
jgi:hypothetical protein